MLAIEPFSLPFLENVLLAGDFLLFVQYFRVKERTSQAMFQRYTTVTVFQTLLVAPGTDIFSARGSTYWVSQSVLQQWPFLFRADFVRMIFLSWSRFLQLSCSSSYVNYAKIHLCICHMHTVIGQNAALQIFVIPSCDQRRLLWEFSSDERSVGKCEV